MITTEAAMQDGDNFTSRNALNFGQISEGLKARDL